MQFSSKTGLKNSVNRDSSEGSKRFDAKPKQIGAQIEMKIGRRGNILEENGGAYRDFVDFLGIWTS